ncbi:hypothetical protein [uncultured Prochlorococcus sp.]|uniref:hypothetical protein n=1 Tax=uncultured Prochlorococcus sp. TaxID=159733 RepID=UPI00258A64F0|nr:hypothetical protein [uncultured Prochlorococcus sp.]
MDLEDKIRESYHCKKFSYSTQKYPFKNLVEEIFGVPLGDLHKWIGEYNVFNRDNDQNTILHKVFYSNFNNKLKEIYNDFINNQVKEYLKEDFYYQKIPTFRVGLPGNKFVGEFHKDSQYNHKGYEINFNLGLSNYLGKAALKVQKERYSNDYIYLECPYGEIFSFDHINCIHGSETNVTDITMVSFDFRIALKRFYYDSDAKSIGNQSSFNRGFYFSDEPVNASHKKNI